MNKFRFGGAETKSTFRVFYWSFGSAVVVLAIDLISGLELPIEYAFMVPLANTVLYALQKFITDNR